MAISILITCVGDHYLLVWWGEQMAIDIRITCVGDHHLLLWWGRSGDNRHAFTMSIVGDF